MESLYKNNTWTLVYKPPKQKLVSYKWIYKLKHSVDAKEPIRYKARLVAKGFTQTQGIDYIMKKSFPCGQTHINQSFVVTNRCL